MEIQTTISITRDLKHLNFPPDTPIKIVIPESRKQTHTGRKSRKGRWAQAVEDIANEKILDSESGEVLRRASEEFRWHVKTA
jgi:hypothetical protein